MHVPTAGSFTTKHQEAVTVTMSVLQVLEEVVNRADEHGYTTLHRAAQHGTRQRVRGLLRCGARVEARTRSDRRTPLHLAAAAGHAGVLPLLITSSTLDRRDASNYTPLQVAAQQRQWGAAAALAAAGASPFSPDFASNPLRLAINAMPHSGAGHAAAELVAAMMRDPGSASLLAEVVSSHNAQQQTVLFIAAYHGCRELVAKLVQAGADREAVTTVGATPLTAAVAQGHVELVPLLATPGNIDLAIHTAGVNGLFAGSVTAMFAAAAKGQESMVAALLETGAAAEAYDSLGQSALGIAARHTNMGVVALLLSALGKQWYDQHALAQTQAHVTGAVKMLACKESDGPCCARLLEVVLDVLGLGVAGEVIDAVQQQLQEEWERPRPPLPPAQGSQRQDSYLAQALLLGWVTAEERLYAARHPLAERMQRLALALKTSGVEQQQQSRYQGSGLSVRAGLLADAELAAAAGQEQQALDLLGQFAALHVEQPPRTAVEFQLQIHSGMLTAVQTRLEAASASANTQYVPSAAATERASSFRPPGVYTTFLSAWVGARRQLQQLPQEVVDTAVKAVKAAQGQAPTGLSGGQLPSRLYGAWQQCSQYPPGSSGAVSTMEAGEGGVVAAVESAVGEQQEQPLPRQQQQRQQQRQQRRQQGRKAGQTQQRGHKQQLQRLRPGHKQQQQRAQQQPTIGGSSSMAGSAWRLVLVAAASALAGATAPLVYRRWGRSKGKAGNSL